MPTRTPPATTVPEARRNFEGYGKPLSPSEPLQRGFYLFRRGDACGLEDLTTLRERLLVSSQPGKICFVTGQVGTGKSTELLFLCYDAEIKERYDVVLVDSIYDQFRPLEFEMSELLVFLAAHVLSPLEDMKALTKLTKNTELSQELKRLSSNLEPSREGRPDFDDLSIQIEVLSMVKTGIKLVPAIRGLIRAFASQDRPGPRRLLERALRARVEAYEKPVLLVVDNLEWVREPETRKRLFVHELAQLEDLPAQLVLTLPYPLLSDPDFQPMQRKHSAYVVPNIKIHRGLSEGEPEPEGWEMARNLVFKRVVPELFEEGVVDQLIDLSGGHLRFLVRLLAETLEEAEAQHATRVGLEHINPARRRLNRDMVNILNGLAMTKDGPAQDAFQVVLDFLKRCNRGGAVLSIRSRAEWDLHEGLAILQYQNEWSWYALHPALLAHPFIRQYLEKEGSP